MAATRRPRGAGGLTKIGPGRYRSSGHDALGKLRTKVHRAKTKTEAEQAHQRWMVAIGSQAVDPGHRTFGDLLDEWWAHHSPSLAPTSRYRTQLLVDKARSGIGHVELAKVTAQVLTYFYAGRGTDPEIGWRMTPHLAHELSGKVVHASLEYGLDMGWVATNANTRARRPVKTKGEHEPPTLDEVLAVVGALLRDGPQWFGVYLHLLAFTGARRGEILALEWADVDLDEGVVYISKNVAHVPGSGMIVKAPKTKSSRRENDVGEGTIAVLRGWQTANTIGSRWVFPGDLAAGDLPVSPNAVDKLWHRHIRPRYGITWRLHDVRHAVASHLLAGGLPIADVARQLGHSSPRVTMTTYAHALVRNRRAAAALLSGITPTGDARP